MTITGFHHTSFTVSDVDRAAAWFIEHFGMERLGGGDYDFDYIKRQTGFADAVLKIAVLGFPGQAGRPGRDVLELIEYRSPAGAPADTATNRPGNAHLCFAVDDIEEAYARLGAAGVEFRSSPNTVTYGVNAGARAVYLVGPDDIRLELFQKRPAGRAVAGRRIAVVRVWQETNSFSQKPTTLADFRRSDWHEGAALTVSLAGRADELAGFAAEIEAAGDTLVPVLAASCWPGGPAEPALIDALAEALERKLAAAGRLDGLLVSLHGAMSGERAPDVEGALLARLRRLLGDSVPLVLTLDHHANVTEAMIGAVDALTAYRQCPHDDMVETGRRGARLLGAILDGRLDPVIAWRKIPLVTPAEGFMTAAEPLASWFALARRLEAGIGAGADISLFPVQPWLDVPEFGWSVTVVAPRERSEAAAAAARALAAHAWAERDRFYVAKLAPAEAVARAARTAGGEGPVVLADGADATNGGSPGDSTCLLAELLRQDVAGPALLTLVDPAAVAAAWAAGEGAELELALGAGVSTRFHRPVTARVRVDRLTEGRFRIDGHISAAVDIGRMAVLTVGGIHIVASEHAGPGHHPAIFRHVGLEPRAAQIVVLKCTVGHMEVFKDIMRESLAVECPGPSPSYLHLLPHRLVDRPLYPLDRDMVWEAPR